MVGTKVTISTINDGIGTPRNDRKYMSSSVGKEVTITARHENGLWLTDLFLPEFKDLKNDYVDNGYLIVSNGNIE